MSHSRHTPPREPTPPLSNLAARADLLQRLRAFFHDRGFIEVETPLVADEVIPELHIEPIRTADGRFLQASPELHMKRLLTAEAKAIFQVTRSFRADELGRLHHPEFTIVEWYRVGDDMAAGITLLDELTQALLGTPTAKHTSYAEAFQQHLGVDPHTATIEQLAAVAKSLSPLCGESDPPFDEADRDQWLNLLLATRIEPNLGRDRPEIIYHYPASQASLAKVVTSDQGYKVAERFELYYRGIELANGFHELCDAVEQRRRFEAVNALRVADGRPALPLPETLLAALEHGLPACTGCALGFDRVVLMATGSDSIDEVIAFPSNRE